MKRLTAKYNPILTQFEWNMEESGQEGIDGEVHSLLVCIPFVRLIFNDSSKV